MLAKQMELLLSSRTIVNYFTLNIKLNGSKIGQPPPKVVFFETLINRKIKIKAKLLLLTATNNTLKKYLFLISNANEMFHFA
jgi:hypothetical protein